MPAKTHVTVFALVTGANFAVVVYADKPIASDWKWGAYTFIKSGDVSYHFFQRGGLLSDGAITDIIRAHVNGEARKINAD